MTNEHLFAMTNQLCEESGKMTNAAGYSGTPLAKKLGIKAGHSLAILDAPETWSIPDLPDDVVLVDDATTASVTLAFYHEASELIATLPSLASEIFPARSLWIAWPRKAAGHASDISENLLREIGLPLGIVDVKVAAIDHDWSGLKFVWRVEHRNRPTPPQFGIAADE